jgi:predicted DCC family thiol-disulfide oxidoreductase YuxK
MATQGAIVLFDGVCNLCNGAVNFLIDRDPGHHLRFAALQSPAGAALLARHGLPAVAEEPETILLIEGDRVHARSTAALRIARYLRFPFWLLAGLQIVPRPLRDLVYRFIARRRYRWFGRSAACRMPTPDLRARFLESEPEAAGQSVLD